MQRIPIQFPQDGEIIPVHRGREITGEVLIKTSDKTVPGLVLPDIV